LRTADVFFQSNIRLGILVRIPLFLIVYNLCLMCGVIFLCPVLIPFVLVKEKYRTRILRRLGWGLAQFGKKNTREQKTIWIHALSVGEVTSSFPLLQGLRSQYPASRLILSVTTSSGQAIAHENMATGVDHIIAAPLDSYFSIKRYLHTIQPDLFILVETDFWPNWLFLLQRRNIPAILVNGRFSAASIARYSRFSWFFRPLFDCFTSLSMQTTEDRDHLISLGISGEKIFTLGNLKLDSLMVSKAPAATNSAVKAAYNIEPECPVWICGSTHEGEEADILKVYEQLQQTFPNLILIIAPRDVDRGRELLQLVQSHKLTGCARSSMNSGDGFEVLILDTLGELSRLYEIGDVAFIGGSMVAKGGHNPVEPAAFGVPVLFGPHMEDFNEIAGELTRVHAAFQVHSVKQMYESVYTLLHDETKKKQAGSKAMEWVKKSQGVVGRHLQLIQQNLCP